MGSDVSHFAASLIVILGNNSLLTCGPTHNVHTPQVLMKCEVKRRFKPTSTTSKSISLQNQCFTTRSNWLTYIQPPTHPPPLPSLFFFFLFLFFNHCTDVSYFILGLSTPEVCEESCVQYTYIYATWTPGSWVFFAGCSRAFLHFVLSYQRALCM